MCPERNAGSLEVDPNIEVIVQFAIKHDGMPAIRGEHRLMPAFDVEDAEASHAKAKISIDEIAAIVGPARDNCVAHSLHNRLRNRLTRTPVPPRYAAHFIAPGTFSHWPFRAPETPVMKLLPTACKELHAISPLAYDHENRAKLRRPH
jgi:hypothetical protein